MYRKKKMQLNQNLKYLYIKSTMKNEIMYDSNKMT